MSTTLRRLKIVLLLAVASLLAQGCGTHRINNSWPDKPSLDRPYRAIVKTIGSTDPAKDLERLKTYYQALQDIVGVQNLEEQYIGCVGCTRLTSGPPPADLTFIYFGEHRKDMWAFAKAWERVQASAVSANGFTLLFDVEPPISGLCSQPVPTCYPIPSCISTDRCDANRALTGCQKCPP